MNMGGSVFNTGGTSASAPEWGGIFSMINDKRLKNGLPSLGFVNPRLYKLAADHPGEAFYDVTQGVTNCGSDGFCCSTGFPAVAGYDPMTGLGSPLWPGLIKYLGSDS
jgi:tripeptidyl-peptidase-1